MAAVGLGWLLIVVGLSERQMAAGGGLVGPAHGLMLPVVSGGLVGLALLRSGWTWRPGVLLVGAGLVMGLLGGAIAGVGLLAIGDASFPVFDWSMPAVRQEVPLVGLALTSVGWLLGAIGVLALAVQARAWPRPLAAALVAVAVHTLPTESIALWDVVATLRSLGSGDGLWWPNFRMSVPVAPSGYLLAAGLLAEAGRSRGGPVAADRWVTALWVGVVGVSLVEGQWALIAALAATAMAVLGLSVESMNRRALRLRLTQAPAVLALLLWSVGFLGTVALSGTPDVFLHDTYAELAADHVLGPLLLCTVLWVGLAQLDEDEVGVWPWLGMALCALVAGLGIAVMQLAMVDLGVQGMPRRYYTYVDGMNGWPQLAVGATLFGTGLWTAWIALGLRAVVRWSRKAAN